MAGDEAPVSPRATYRIQLTPGSGFDHVAALADYLARLGVSHVYCSPYLQAAPGSEHGYDVTDHSRLSEELGGRAGFEKMCAALAERGLGHIADHVPNHLAADARQPAWWDVLKRGRASPYASWFDIDWDARDGKVMLGILDDGLQAILERGELSRDGSLLRYFDYALPIAPGTEEIADLRSLLDAQHYELVNWSYAVRNLNYRRFFDVQKLVGLRIEEPEVFEAVHSSILGLLKSGLLQGLRIDHIDGLRDPLAYLRKLRERIGDAFLVVEKILDTDETLPPEWPVQGTTGYEFIGLVGGLFIDRSSEERLTRFYRDFTGMDVDPDALARSRKMLVMRFVLPAELSRLARKLERVFDSLSWSEEIDILRVALAEAIAGLDVYRTYITPEGQISTIDRERIEDAIASARAGSFLPRSTFDRLRSVLLLEEGGNEGLEFVLSLQQSTGSVMAKAMEDTFFYNYNRFIALNEVGSSPLRFGRDPSELFAWRGGGLLASSTHDTKRSEDVRARLACFSEIPAEWETCVEELSRLAERYRTADMPDRNTEYFLLQTLVGAWPLDVERATRYMNKAAREAKRYTSWLDPDPGYEESLERFVRGILGDPAVVETLEGFVERILEAGRVNSLAQTLIKLTMPGVPDIYQGCELWNLSLVDPDNRRPVDHDARLRALSRIEEVDARTLWAEPDDGAPKLLVIQRALALRAETGGAFDEPPQPLAVAGDRAAHTIAYAVGEKAVVLVPRLTIDLRWGTTRIELPERPYRNELTGRTFEGGGTLVEDVLDGFPVALLRSI